MKLIMDDAMCVYLLGVPDGVHDSNSPLPLCRIRDSTTALRRAEEKAEELQAYISSSGRVHQTLTDEHHALQLVFNSTEKKLHDTERENDRLVGVHSSIHGFAKTVFDVFTCSGSYVTRPLVGKKRMLTDMRDVRL